MFSVCFAAQKSAHKKSVALTYYKNGTVHLGTFVVVFPYLIISSYLGGHAFGK